MKDKIYVIPINESLERECFCPFCDLHKRLEQESVSYTVGAAMMEPDFRIITNRTGFCRKHIRELNAQSKALPLSLVIDTHLDAICEILDTDLSVQKKNVFHKSESKIKSVEEKLSQISASCAICDRINATFERYFEVFVYMLKKEDGFLDKVLSTEGFCMEHYSKLFTTASSYFSDSEFNRLFKPIAEHQKKRVKKFKKYIQNFIQSFDYRNAKNKIDAPADILFQTSCLLNGEFEPKNKKLDNI